MAHQLRVALKHSDPKVFRTLVVPEGFTFHQLHVAIQCAMNWENQHLYQFAAGGLYQGTRITESLPEDEMDFGFDDSLNADETYLADYCNGQSKKLEYEYDFGDSWIHEISVNKKPNEEPLYPKCIRGGFPAPIEDCGGIPGFYNLIDTMRKSKKTAEEKEHLRWFGLPLTKHYEDVLPFDIDLANTRLINTFKDL